jgi:thiamine-monophosphate kinase
VSEAAVLQEILAVLGTRPGVLVGIGDDTAVLDADPPLLLAHDMLVEDVHFRWTTHTWADVGHAALAVNLSDIAAMGGEPIAAVVGLASPTGMLRSAEVREFYAAMERLAEASGCSIIGGDISRARETVVGVTVVGRMPVGIAPVLRSGARPGQVVCVTGRLGRSAAGRLLLNDPPARARPLDAQLVAAHQRPEPRLADGRTLARAGVSAMMDISDGLCLDAERMALASGVRITIDLDRVPIGEGVSAVALDAGIDAAELASTGGEDYELLLALDPALVAAVGIALTPVGTVSADGTPGLATLRGGRPVRLARLGWDHVG